MQFQIIDGPAGTSTIVLDGKLDVKGADAIAMPMSVLGGSKKGLIVDMSALTFLASLGIRHLVSAAKAIGRRGGRVVLLKPSTSIAEVLQTSGVTDLMSIAYSEAEAKSALGVGT